MGSARRTRRTCEWSCLASWSDPGLLTVGCDRFVCANTETFFVASIVWGASACSSAYRIVDDGCLCVGAVGPERQFSSGQIYQ